MEKSCKECPFFKKDRMTTEDFSINKCVPDRCDTKTSHLSIHINPLCVSTFTLFSQLLVANIYKISFAYLGLILLYFSVIVMRDQKVKNERKKTEEQDQNFGEEDRLIPLKQTLTFLGKNVYWDQWYIDTQVSREFECFIDKGELLELIRVRLCFRVNKLGD
jgi:hypothetical protein